MKKMLVSLGKQSFIYTLGSFAGPLAGIFMVPIYTHIFTTDDFGVIDMITVIISLIIAILIMGTDNATGRFYVDPVNVSDRKTIASTSIIYRGLILSLGCIILIIFSGEISQLVFHTRDYSQYMIIAFATIPINQCFIFFQELLRYNFRYISYTILTTSKILINVSLAILLVVIIKLGVAGVFWATLISATIALLISFSLTKQYLSFHCSSVRLKELLIYGIPLVPYSVTVYIIQNCDRYFLIKYSTLEQVGLYGIGMRLASFVAILFIGTNAAWGPLLYSIYKEENAIRLYHKVADYSIALTILGVVCISIFAKEVLMILTTPEYYGADIVVPSLASYMAFYYLGLRLSQGINIAKKTIHFTWISIITALINIGLNFILVPKYGMSGAALATLACSMVWCVLLVFMSQKYYRIDYNYLAYFKIFLISTLSILIVYLFIPYVTWYGILIKVGILIFISVSLYFFKLIGKDEILYAKSLLIRLKMKYSA